MKVFPRRSQTVAVLAVLLASTCMVTETEAGAWDWFWNNPVTKWVENVVADEVDSIIPGPILETLKLMIHTADMSPDCRNVVEQCIDPSFPGSCKEDLMDCAYEALFGAEVEPKYADLGTLVSMKDILTQAAKEIGVSSDVYLGKKALKQCLNYVDSSWLTIYENWTDGRIPNVTSPQNDFVCRALLNKDVPRKFPSTLAAPSDCPALQQAILECKSSVTTPTLETAFAAYYPIIKKSNGTPIPQPKGKKDKNAKPVEAINFKDCWANGDRTECIAAAFLGSVCVPACPMADCVNQKLLKSSKDCAATLAANEARFYQAATQQCLDLAETLQVDGVDVCPSPSTPSGSGDGGNGRKVAGSAGSLGGMITSTIVGVAATTLFL